MVGLHILHYFIDNFDVYPIRAWCIFHIKITGTKSMKSKLRVISDVITVSGLAGVLAFIEEKLYC